MYFRADTPLPPFLPLPRFLLERRCSINAKLLYGLLLARSTVSRRNGWVSGEGNCYVIYPVQHMARDLARSERTVKTALRELEDDGLIQRIRPNMRKAARIFVLLPEEGLRSSPEDGAFPDEVQLSSPCEGQVSSPCEGQSLPPRKKEREKTEGNQTEEREKRARPFGMHQNVFLSPGEVAALQRDYPGRWEEYIRRLSAYMASNGRHYASHYATLCKWMDEDARGRQPLYDHGSGDAGEEGASL